MTPYDLVRVDYLTLEIGDPIYGEYGEYVGEVTEVSGIVRISDLACTIEDAESFYTPNKNFYSSPTEKQQDQEESLQKPKIPKKILTSEEIYGMLLSDVSLLGVSKKAVRKIEKAVLAKIHQGEY